MTAPAPESRADCGPWDVLFGLLVLFLIVVGVLVGIGGVTWTAKMLADDYREAAASARARKDTEARARDDAEARDSFLRACLVVTNGDADAASKCADIMMERRRSF